MEAARKEETAYRGESSARKFCRGSRPQSADIVPEWFVEQKQKEELKREQDKMALAQRDRNADRAEVEQLLEEYGSGGG